MNKSIIGMVMGLVLMGMVTAWTCTETDDGVEGWFNSYQSTLPEGCSKLWDIHWTGNCEDQCLETTYRDFDCVKRYPNLPNNHEKVIKWTDEADSDKCEPEQPEVPEFTTVGAFIALGGIGYIIHKKRRN